MADQDRNRGQGDNRRDGWRRDNTNSRKAGAGDRGGGNRRGPEPGDRPRRDSEGTERRSNYTRDSGERGAGGYNRDRGERRTDGGFSRDRGDRRTDSYSRDRGERRTDGPSRDSGQRRTGGGISRDNGERRTGGYNRDSGQRARDERPDRNSRGETGRSDRPQEAGNRGGSWQDRPARGGDSRQGGRDKRSQDRQFGSGSTPERGSGRRDTGEFRRDRAGAEGQRWGSRESGRGERPFERSDRSRPVGDERRSPREPQTGKSARPWGSREGSANRGGSSYGDDRRQGRSYSDAPRSGDRREGDRTRRPERSPRDTGPTEGEFSRPHNARDLRSANRPDRERSPEIDEDVTGSELDKITRAEIRNLEERSSLWVAKHLVMAGRLIDDEPELAFQHALAASRRGGRLAVVREAVGLTAYAAGHYGEALREFRTYRRISGSDEHLPVMADCERGMGRPDRALDLARSEDAAKLDTAGKVELAIVVSGARTDLGQLEAAVAALEIPQLTKNRAFSYSPRLFRAYAEALEAVGRTEEAGSWRRQAEVAENALGVGAFADPDIIDLVGDEEEPELDRKAAAGTVRSVSPSADVTSRADADSMDEDSAGSANGAGATEAEASGVTKPRDSE